MMAERSRYFAMALLNRDGVLLVSRCTEDQMLHALTVGTSHNEVQRAYGPLAIGETVDDVAEVYGTAWGAKATRIRYWA